MTNDGFAPSIFTRVSQQGVPAKGILFTARIALVSLLTKYVSAETLYLYLIASTGQVGYLEWMVIAWCQYRFRCRVNKGTYPPETISFRSPLFPWLAVFAIVMNILIIGGTWFSDGGGIMLATEAVLMVMILFSFRFGGHRLQHQRANGRIPPPNSG